MSNEYVDINEYRRVESLVAELRQIIERQRQQIEQLTREAAA